MLLWGASADASQRKVRRARVLTFEVQEFDPCGSSCFRNLNLSPMASGRRFEDDYQPIAGRRLPAICINDRTSGDDSAG